MVYIDPNFKFGLMTSYYFVKNVTLLTSDTVADKNIQTLFAMISIMLRRQIRGEWK